MNRYHDQGNSCKGQHLIGSGLQVQRFSPFSSKWQHLGRHGAAELRVLHLHLKAAIRRLASRELEWGSTSTVTQSTICRTISGQVVLGYVYKKATWETRETFLNGFCFSCCFWVPVLSYCHASLNGMWPWICKQKCTLFVSSLFWSVFLITAMERRLRQYPLPSEKCKLKLL